MGDVSALEKQLKVKNATIAELQATLDEKTRCSFEDSDTLENKDRGIYYLERSIEARNRDLTALRNEAKEIEAKGSAEFAKQIDKGAGELEALDAENSAIQEQITATEVNVKHGEYMADKYKEILDKVAKGMPEENIVEEMQAAISDVENQNKADKQMLNDLKAAVTDVAKGLETLKGAAKFLEQYRVDAILRVFTLKGKIKCLKNRLSRMQ
jgi:chromosome segregation ATPase